VVCGLPGVGKTTVSERVAGHLDGRLLRTDVVRKELFDDPDYTDQEERRVYGELLDRARASLRRGESVVLDGTFYAARYRDRAASVADAVGVDARFVRVDCEARVVRDRIAAREDDESDGGVEVFELYRDLFEPLERDHVTVDNGGSLAATRRQVDRQFYRPEAVGEERV
jgi:predicted kinase